MHKTNEEAKLFVNRLINDLAGKRFKIVVCPPFVSLADVVEITRGTNISVGAQNCYFERSGAFTGEVSPTMLRAIGVEYVIVGHSERRKYFNETDEMVNKKLKAVLSEGMRPIICVGETKEEREKGLTFCVVEMQIRQALYGLSREEVENIVIAYEPVWAIGTGVVAKPEQAQEVHRFIRKLLCELYDAQLAESIPILYGGSIKPGNFFAIMAQPDVDGGLVGGASLDEQFVRLAQIVQSFAV
ncbi:MAG: Triosephosphate isomerase [Thermotoga sp. 50_1627]|uniref:triose-phosphate isomerase n=1 Tax=Pseudothermotoga sp. TaxID=2033661 RepID=UPI00076CDD22|nr:MAG: Triosephosphate isomerase [Thermotoga sp. 50_64]KUK25964.1 MAG: Triosephosphate isomerase [Thermotoga sp. 50_1627]MBC7116053.1 triose-phosphate isomerase [Pseudothermotoga sp.]MDK2922653.1 triosephosphate isomerase [Pseudothermotoga sp.]HBT38627.1 triose-phosphate isomerase [Pseudothermotoga sp.]